MNLLMRSPDTRDALLRGARQWPLLAVPVTFCAVAALLISGTAPPLAPPTGALITTSPDTPQLARTVSGEVALAYTDPGRGQDSTLHLTPTAARADTDHAARVMP